MNAHTFTQADLDGIAALRAAVYANGWQPIEVYTGRKNPVGEAWTLRVGVPKSTTRGAANTGILAVGLRAVDLDIDNPTDLATARQILEEYAGPTPLVRRRADSCRLLLVYRAMGETMPGKRVVGLGDPLPNGDWSRGKVEILGNGQQFVAFGTHPDGADYEWAEASPATTAKATAPVLTEDAENALDAALKAAFPPTAKRQAEPSPEAERKERGHSFFDRVNDAAMADLAAWVPTVFPAARTYQDGYRVSSADLGRDLEEDLSILPKGIKDFGVYDLGDPRKGNRTPIDLVVRWGNLGLLPNARKAAFWLCERLGRKPAELGWEDGEAAGEKANTVPVLTQDRLALVFAEQHEGRLRYCHDTGAWFEWDGTVWKRDRKERAFQFSRKVARSAAEGGSKNELKEAGKVSFASGVEKFAQSDPRLAVTVEAWDRDAFLLGTPGGTVDLRTGQLRRSAPEDGITKLTGCAPAATVDCPRFLQFLDEAFDRKADVIRFVQQFAGYCLTGDTREHTLVFGYGAGKNGKSVFADTLAGILGDYAVTANMEVFVASTHDRHPTELARLRGARLVTASETEEGRAWAESRIKSLTGGDKIAARHMRQDFFEFTPEFKLLIIGNHRPVLRNIDEAARRRFRILPFVHTPAVPDPLLKEKLRDEWSGILRWAIEGCLDWQANGLTVPEGVRAETENYFSDQDLLGQWLEEKCEVDMGNAYKSEASSDLFASFSEFALAAGEQPGSGKTFSQSLERRGFTKHRTMTGRQFVGLRLRRPRDPRHDA